MDHGHAKAPAELDDHYQRCPSCNNLMGAIRGSPSAICRHCGFKDGCCF